MFSLVFLCYRFLASRGSRRAGLVLASDFQRTCFLPSSYPFVPSESGCKSTTFSPFRKHFFQLFFHFLVSHWLSTGKIFKREGKRGFFHTYINIMMRHQRGKNASSAWPIMGFPPLKTTETGRLVAALPSLTETSRLFPQGISTFNHQFYLSFLVIRFATPIAPVGHTKRQRWQPTQRFPSRCG